MERSRRSKIDKRSKGRGGGWQQSGEPRGVTEGYLELISSYCRLRERSSEEVEELCWKLTDLLDAEDRGEAVLEAQVGEAIE